MKKTKLPLMIQDIRVTYDESLKNPVEGYEACQKYFLNGPVSERVAIIDFDPETGELVNEVRFEKRNDNSSFTHNCCDINGDILNEYQMDRLFTPAFMQASTFATVLKTIELLEKDFILGREFQWAFDSNQLLVVPRAGEQANAFYCRESNSIEFFYFDSKDEENKVTTIYSCMSREIIAHETGHALIDGIAPDLMNAYTPDSLAIHEGIADIIALLVSFKSNNLGKFVLYKSSGSLKTTSHFTNMAEEFARGRGIKDGGIRNFLNDKNLIEGHKYFVDSNEAHDLSEVLSGALYKLIVERHESEKKILAKLNRFKKKNNPEFSASGAALANVSKIMKEIIFRGLDYLPPGEISFADFARSLIIADRIRDNYKYFRDWLAKEFVDRGMAELKGDIYKPTITKEIKFLDLNITKLCKKSNYSYHFISSNKKIFFIPSKINDFEIKSSEIVYYSAKENGKKVSRKLCILKVSWIDQEKNNLGNERIPHFRAIQQGCTLIIDVKSKKLISRLSNVIPNEEYKKNPDFDYERRKKEYKKNYTSRNKHLIRLIEKGQLNLGRKVDEEKNIVSVNGFEMNGLLHINGAFKTLHLCKSLNI